MSSVLDGPIFWAIWEKLPMFREWEAMFTPVKKFAVAPCALYGVVGSTEEESSKSEGVWRVWHSGERPEIREGFNAFIHISVSFNRLVGESQLVSGFFPSLGPDFLGRCSWIREVVRWCISYRV